MEAKSANRAAKFLNSSALSRPLMILSAASVLFGASSAQALDPGALPQNPNVVGGKATFSQGQNTLNVNQSSNRAIIDWRSFNIGSAAQTNFNQPNAKSIAVNRVNGSADPTQIEGGLHANGQVWILNPNGVFFGKTARVDAAGVVASTANINDKAFMAGSNTLQMTGADHGAVENQGNISVGANGLAAFVAPSVRNSGTINATLGKVALAAGTTYTLDLAGDKLVELGLGSVKAVVDQSGKIVNPGGTVALTAKAAGQVVNSVVNVSGIVDASSATKSGGDIILGAGNVTTTATAQVKADAGTNGNGGTITSVAENHGNYAGSFSAKGGSQSGNGGSIETSGKSVAVTSTAKIDASAAHGAAGKWTLDPLNVTISTGTDDGTKTGATVKTGTIEHSLNTGTSVDITTSQDGTEDGDLTLAGSINATSTGGAGLTLEGRHLSATGNSTISIDGGALTLDVNTVNNTLTPGIGWINDAYKMIGTVSGGTTINLGAGTYPVSTAGAQYIDITKPNITLNGAGESSTIIDARALTSYTLLVQADNTTLRNFTLLGSPSAVTTSGSGIRALPSVSGTTDPNARVHNLNISHVTSHGAYKSQLDLNSVDGATVDHFTADGTSNGVGSGSVAGAGISITDSQDVKITNSSTNNNAYGGLAIYQSNSAHYNGQTTGLVVDSSNSFGEAKPIYMEDESASQDFGTVNIAGYDYVAIVPVATNDTYTLFQTTAQNAVDLTSGLSSAYVEGWTGTATNNNFTVGTTSGGTAMSIGTAVTQASSGATINVLNGTYVVSAANGYANGYLGVTKSLTIDGQSETGTIIDARNASQYGVRVQADNVTLSNFTLWGVNSATPPAHFAGYGVKAEDVANLSIDHVDSKGAYKAQFDLNGVRGGTLNFVTADGTSNGVGSGSTAGAAIAITDSQTILLENSSTKNGAWGGVAIQQANGSISGGYSYQAKDITIAASNTFGEATPVYMQDTSTTNNFSNVTVNGFNYAMVDNTNANSLVTVFEKTPQAAIDSAAAHTVSGDYVEGWTGTAGNNNFYVGTSSGGTAMSINAAVGAATSGAIVNVEAGTYSDSIDIDKSLTLRGANAGINAADGSGTAPATRGAESILSHNGLSAISVDAANVTIDGFEFTGGNGRIIDWASAANIDGLKIQNNIFNLPSGPQNGGVIQLSGIGTATNIHIANNLFEGNAFAASGDISSTWVYVGGSTANGYQGLTLSGNDFTGGADNAVFQAASNFGGLSVTNNYFNGSNGLIEGLNMGSLDDPTITGNKFVGVIYTGMQVGTTNGGLIQGNSFDGTGSGFVSGGVRSASGMEVWGGQYGTASSNGLVIDTNTFKNFTDSTPLSASDRVAAIYLRPADSGLGGAGPVTITGNTITNNTVGLLANTSVTGSNVSGNIFTNNATQVKDLQGAFDLGELAADNNLDRDVWIDGGNALFGSIQTGVNAASAGDTVNVGAGTYEEQVIVDGKALSIVGAGQANTIIEAPDLLSGFTAGGSLRKGVVLVENGSNVSISNLTVDGLGKGNAASNFVGIEFYNAGGTVDGVHITGIHDGGVGGALDGAEEGYGLAAFNEDSTARTVTLQNSTIDGFEKNGAVFKGGDVTANVIGNTITGGGSTAAIAQNGIEFYGTTGTVSGTISGNTISGVGYAPASNWSSSGILLIGADGTAVENNGLTGTGTGDYSNGIYVSGGTVTVANNAVANFGWGVDIDDDGGPTNVTVSNNSITGNGVGMEVAYQEGDTSVVNAHSNDFSNNASSIELESADATLDATGNYWGTTGETAILAGMSGTDAASVNFSSFLANGTDTDAATAGFQGDFSNLIVTSLGGGMDRISEAVSEVSTGGTIDVNAGTYTLSNTLNIAKSLSLVGAGEGATTIDGSGVSSNTMRVSADNVSLSGFTLESSVNGFNGISVLKSSGFDGNGFPLSGQGVRNFSIANVTINKHSAGSFGGLSLTGVEGATVDHVTVDGGGSGNGIQIADSANVVLTNTKTSNSDFGLVILQEGDATSEQTTGFSADTSNSFVAALAPVRIIDASTSGPGVGTLNIQGFAYAIGTPDASAGENFVELHNGLQDTIDRAVALDAANSTVEGWTGSNLDNLFDVGFSTGGTALSINAAANTANAGGTINVAAGTYAEDVSAAKQLAFNFDDVTVNSFALASGAAGSSLTGDLTATGAITSAGSVILSGNLAGGSIALNGATTLLGNTTLAAKGAVVTASIDGIKAGAQALTVNAATASLGNLGATTGLGAVTDNAATTLTGTTYDASSLNLGALTLTGNTTLDATGAVVASSVDGTKAGAQALTVNAATASLGNLGAKTALGAVSDTAATTLTGTTYDASSLNFGALTLTGNTTLDATGAVVASSVDGSKAGAQALTVKAATASLGNLGAKTALGAVSDTGATTLTGIVYDANSLNFGALTLTGNTTLDATGAVVTGSVDGTTAGAQALTVNAVTASLGNLGATTGLGAVSGNAATTLTGSTYDANSFGFGGALTLTAASTTLNTTQSATAAGDIVFGGDIFGTTNGGQSLVLIAGPGTGAASANGEISLQNAGTLDNRLNNMTVSGNDFTALTVDLAGDYNSALTGNQVFAADTLNTLGSANSNVAGDAAGHINASGDVAFNVGGNLGGTISGQNVNVQAGTVSGADITGSQSIDLTAQSVSNTTLTAPTVTAAADAFDATVAASNSATITANTIGGTYTGGTITLLASNNVDATVNSTNLNVTAPQGTVTGTWNQLSTNGSGTLNINGEANVDTRAVNPNQLVVEGFVLPAGSSISSSGELILPEGVVLGLLSPGGNKKPKVILVHDVRQLGALLASGYTAIVIDLSGNTKTLPTKLAMN